MEPGDIKKMRFSERSYHGLQRANPYLFRVRVLDQESSDGSSLARFAVLNVSVQILYAPRSQQGKDMVKLILSLKQRRLDNLFRISRSVIIASQQI